MSFDIFPSSLAGMSPGMTPNMSMPHDVPLQRIAQQMRIMRMVDAMGHGMGRTGGGYRQAAPGSLDMSTGADPSTMDTDQANEMLRQFGQQLPSNPSPYAMLSNSGFFGAHQRIGGALEAGLFGAANTGPSNTIGEGISNAARGILGGTAERGRAINQQFTQPFASAQGIAQLMQAKQNLDLNAAHENLYEAQAHKDLAAPDFPWHGLTKVTDPNDPNFGKTVGWRKGQEDLGMQPLPGQNQGFVAPKAAKPWGGTLPSSLYAYAGKAGIPSDRELTSDEYNHVLSGYVRDQGGLRAIGAGVAGADAATRQEITDLQAKAKLGYESEFVKPDIKPSEFRSRFGHRAEPGEIDRMNAATNAKWGIPTQFPGSTTPNTPTSTPKTTSPMPSRIPPKTPSTGGGGNWNPRTGHYDNLVSGHSDNF